MFASALSAIVIPQAGKPPHDGRKRMNLYGVIIFEGDNWHIIRTYSVKQEAERFAEGLWVEWDIKEMSLDNANEGDNR